MDEMNPMDLAMDPAMEGAEVTPAMPVEGDVEEETETGADEA